MPVPRNVPLRSVVILMVMLLAGLLPSCSNDSGSTSNESLRIYEMIADKGGFVAVTGDTTGNKFQLTLSSVPSSMLYFTDRPAQESGYDTTANVINNVWPRVYGAVAPNALLQATVANQATINLFCTLEKPVYNAATGQLSFTLTYLNGNQKPISSLNVTDIKMIILNNAASAQVEEWSQLMEGGVGVFSTPAADGTVSITLQQPYGSVFSYTNAPGRKSTIIALKDYLQTWQTRFGSVQPNISFAYNLLGGQTAGVQIVSITKIPVYDETAGTITFTAKILYGTTPVGTGGLRVTSPSLFVDGGSATYSETDLQKLKTTNSCANCDLEEAPLDSLSLNKANLSGANLKRANLSNTDLSNANLQNADLTGATITGTKLANADTSNAIMTEGVPGRLITLVNNCSITIDVGAMGNVPKDNCASHDQCEANAYCRLSDTQCQFVPIPILKGDLIDPARKCTVNADCCTGSSCNQFCYITVPGNGQCANIPSADRNNYWQLSAGASQTVLIPNRWGGRFWPRTGCTTQGTVCKEIWGGTDADCNDPPAGLNGIDRTLTTTSQYTAEYCRTTSDCTKGTCDTAAVYGFFAAPPDKDECQTDAECDTKYSDKGKNLTCVSPPASQATVKRCGFHQCKLFKCSDSNMCNPLQFQCDTGKCLGADNTNFSKFCRFAGKSPATLAEVNLYPFANNSNDFYDVSMVDGGNVPVSIAPNPTSYTLDHPSFVKSGTPCQTDDQCNTTAGSQSWACKSGKCVYLFACGSPGCVSDCDSYGYSWPDSLKSKLKSNWAGSNFAVSYKDCPSELRLLMSKGAIVTEDKEENYKGCMAPKEVCADKSLNVSGYTTLKCDEKTIANFLDMYKCDGTYLTSCYSGTGTPVCGCPGWSIDEQCTSTDPTWVTYALPYYSVFHKASPVTYSYAYDDKGATFQCRSKNETIQTSYTITFCPK